jgi:hypothetical protein
MLSIKHQARKKVKKIFRELFDKIREKSQDEIAKAIVSEVIKYGSPIAALFLVHICRFGPATLPGLPLLLVYQSQMETIFSGRNSCPQSLQMETIPSDIHQHV